jgi:ADP-heptose:LPS heptosyltransferase
VIRCTKLQFPDYKIHYLTKAQFATVLKENQYIDKIYTIKNNISEVFSELKTEKYDVVIDLHKNFRSLGVRFQLGTKSYSFPKLNFEKWLLVHCKINRMPDVHIVDRYFEAVKNLGVKNDYLGLDFFIPEKDKIDLASLPSGFQDGYTGLVIGGKHKTKQLPVEKTIELCRKLHYPVIILGGKEDRDEAEKIVTASGIVTFNACGLYNLNQSASLVQQADVVITNDTGLMHIAAAFHKKIISIWGNTVPELGMYPYLPKEPEQYSIFEVKNLPCRPCSKIGFTSCPKKHFRCMMDQDTTEIAKQAKRFLEE